MKVSQKEFHQRYAHGNLVLSLVGMSNIGKSYWSEALTALGFTRFCIDDLIEERLGPELRSMGYAGLADVARWLGQPYDERYTTNQETYLTYEAESVVQVLDALRQGMRGNTVIDTTGSMAHLESALKNRLRAETLVIHLAASDAMKQEMFERYMAEPKPVCWGDVYHPHNEESGHETVQQCYPLLLDYRTKQFASMADVSINRTDLSPAMSAEAFLHNIQICL